MMKKYAEILVKCGYAVEKGSLGSYIRVVDPEWPSKSGNRAEKVDTFADTLEGRRQVDAIEDWLHQKHGRLIEKAKHAVMTTNPYNGRQKRLDRIKWCVDNMEKAI